MGEWIIGEDYFRVCSLCTIVFSDHVSADKHQYITGHVCVAFPTVDYKEKLFNEEDWKLGGDY